MTENLHGTKEYAPRNENCFYGCTNNCRYCYAKAIALHYKRISKPEDWKTMRLNEKKFNRNFRKRSGLTMYPTSHDITKETLETQIAFLYKYLKPGNNVLITTKPDLWCIQQITHQLRAFKEQIIFLFTITSKSNYYLRFWEPNAPNLEERISSLRLAGFKGFRTRVSIEPYLDKDPIPLIIAVIKANPDLEEIWLGPMTNISRSGFNEDEKKFYVRQRNICSWENIKIILKNLRALPERAKSKIRLKNTIRKKYKQKTGFDLEVRLD